MHLFFLFDYIYTRDLGGRVTAIANHQVPTVATGQSDLSYNPDNNQLNTMTGAVAKTCTYDANGNILSDGTHTFIYDGLNRIIQVEDQSGIIATYGYDNSNRRIRKTVGSTTTHYLYDLNSQLIAETAVDGTPLREYIYLDGEPIAVKEYQNNPGTYYYINDHLGTPQQLVDGSGTVVWRAAYLPFGKAQIAVETVQNNLRFPGQYYDAETGLHYNWHRFYEPETGRYISADPIGLAGGMNLYAYVGGDPANWFDSTGLFGDGAAGGGTYTGHSDFYGGNAFEYPYEPFDFTRQDHGRSSPYNPFSTWEHFRELSDVEKKLNTAVMKCDRQWFEIYIHQGQDYFSHRSKGYHWLRTFGHIFDGDTPDRDMRAWYKANEWTKNWVDQWVKNCECPSDAKKRIF